MPTPHPIIVFDDGRGQLGPMTDLRASFEVRTGMFTTGGRIAVLHPRRLAGYWVRPPLVALLRERANAPVNELPSDEIVCCVNGRWALPDAELDLAVGHALVEADSEHVVAAVLRRAEAEYLLESGQLHELTSIRKHPERLLYRYPWDVIALMSETIPHDILATRVNDAQLVNERDDVVGDHPVEVHESARIFPQVVFDVTAGPIMVHEGAVVRPGAILCGPCAIGPGATVLDQAIIKANTVIGRLSKVAGEIGATIFQGFANKAHHGHLGDSWVGEWANLGAGTTNSNLLNTYTEISMRIDPDGPMHRTGLTFLGAIIGDHVKVSINTSITTGSVFGTGAMIATSRRPPATVRRFAWLTDRGEQRFRLEKFLATATAVMTRRDRAPSDAYVSVLSDLHAAPRGDLVDSGLS